MSALSPIDLPPAPRFSTPTTPVLPTPRCTSMPHSASLVATISAVRCSSSPNSGLACRSRRMAVSSSWKPRIASSAGTVLAIDFHLGDAHHVAPLGKLSFLVGAEGRPRAHVHGDALLD